MSSGDQIDELERLRRRCTELETRLQNFERETFEKLRGRVKELEEALKTVEEERDRYAQMVNTNTGYFE